MRCAWITGVLHGIVGSAILFLTLHPLRDALDAHALELSKIASIFEAIQGVSLMAIAHAGHGRIPAFLIALGAAVSCSMLYVIAFTGLHPFDPAVPLGGLVTMIGWLGLLFIAPQSARR